MPPINPNLGRFQAQAQMRAEVKSTDTSKADTAETEVTKDVRPAGTTDKTTYGIKSFGTVPGAERWAMENCEKMHDGEWVRIGDRYYKAVLDFEYIDKETGSRKQVYKFEDTGHTA